VDNLLFLSKGDVKFFCSVAKKMAPLL